MATVIEINTAWLHDSPFGAYFDSLNPFMSAPVAGLPTDISLTSFTANWEAVENATGYILTVSNGSVSTDYPLGNVTSHNVTGLAQNSLYTYKVKMLNGSNAGNYSNSVTVTTTANYNVSTFAGTENFYSDAQGQYASFNNPWGVVTDTSGNIYVADTNNYRIRKVTPSGLVSTFATGVIAFSLTIDNSNNIYAAVGSEGIKKIDTNGNVTTMNLNPAIEYVVGITFDGGSYLYINDRDRIKRVTISTGAVAFIAGHDEWGHVNGSGSSARFDDPFGLSFHSSYIYVADRRNCAIRRVSTGGSVTTFAGGSACNGTDGTGTNVNFNYPSGITKDGSGNFYIADGTVIRRMTTGAVVTTIAGQAGNVGYLDAIGANARFSSAAGVARDSSGNLFVTDTSRVRKINTSFNVTTLAGGGSFLDDSVSTRARFNKPNGIVRDSNGNIFVADKNNHRIRKISTGGAVTTFAGNGIGSFADGIGTAASFNAPFGLTIDSSNNLYVADSSNHRIRKITPDGVVTTFAGSTSGNVDAQGTSARFSSPSGITIDANGNLYVADTSNNRIKRIDTHGNVTVAGNSSGFAEGQSTSALFSSPEGIFAAGDGSVYISDSNNNRIRRIIP